MSDSGSEDDVRASVTEDVRGRSRRAVGRRQKDKDDAVAMLRKLKRGEDVDMEVEENVYDVVDEDRYSKVVKSRQRDEEFVSGDEDGEYADDGGEWWEDEDDDEEGGGGHRRDMAPIDRRGRRRGDINMTRKKPVKRINQAFLGTTHTKRGQQIGPGMMTTDNDDLGGSTDNAGDSSTAPGNADFLASLFESGGYTEAKSAPSTVAATVNTTATASTTSTSSGNPFGRSLASTTAAHASPPAAPAPSGRRKRRNDDDVALLGNMNEAKDAYLTQGLLVGKKQRRAGGKKNAGSSKSAAAAAAAMLALDCMTATSLPEEAVRAADEAAADAERRDAEMERQRSAFGGGDFEEGGFSRGNSSGKTGSAGAGGAGSGARLVAVPDEGDSDEGDDGETNVPATLMGVNVDWMRNKAGTAVDGDAAGEGVSSTSTAASHVRAPTTSLDTSSSLPLSKVGDEQLLRFYYLEAYEDPFASKGVVFLFGKVLDEASQTHQSCCLSVEHLQRTLYVLPREFEVDHKGNVTDQAVTMQRVHEEISDLLEKHGITTMQAKGEMRKFAFEVNNVDVPAEAMYLKVRYDASFPQLPLGQSGRTFSTIFGTQTSLLELLVVEYGLKGPGWLDIVNPSKPDRRVSWCRLEGTIKQPAGHIRVVDASSAGPAPSLVVMCFSLKTVLNRQTHRNEIAAVTMTTHRAINTDGPTPNASRNYEVVTAVTPLSTIALPFDLQDIVRQQQLPIKAQANETAMLSFVLAHIHRCDPDVILGHNFFGFDLDVLLHAMRQLKVLHWSKLGRLRRGKMPKLQTGAGGVGESTFAERQVASGRIICDTWVSAREFVRHKSYGLSELSEHLLKTQRPKMDFETIPTMYSNGADLLHLLNYNANDTFLIFELMLKLSVLPLTKQLTNTAGNLWSRTLSGGRAERNEYLLLHEFYARGFICPDKTFANKAKATAAADDGDDTNNNNNNNDASDAPKRSRRKPAYSGGLVLEPKRGFYDHFILLLDFNSLYPSIIQEYNICFTTITRPTHGANATGDDEMLAELPEEEIPTGVLPHLLHNLVQRRRQVKALIKDELKKDPHRQSKTKLQQLDIRQKALKLTANSMYGCLGFAHSRFFAKHLAQLITSKGRETLQRTVDLAQNDLNLDVIYGDTDSIMINSRSTDYEDVLKIGNQVKVAVNKLYKKLEIDIDGVYKTMLLLQKKKYAALMIVERDNGQGGKELHMEKETKGIDVVRRDWCELSHDAGNFVLNQILSDMPRESLVESIHEFLQQMAENVREERVPLGKFVINKGLTKAPEEYADRKLQAHVQVALRMKAQGKSVRAGDTIPYVVCEMDDPSPANRAMHPDDMTRSSGPNGAPYKADKTWYLKHQVHPLVSRLCDPIEGTNKSLLAECLGLDASSFMRDDADQAARDAHDVARFNLPDEERFRDVDKLSLVCRACKTDFVLDGAFRENATPAATDVTGPAPLVSSLQCPKCGTLANPIALWNRLALLIRKHTARHYDGWAQCDDSACERRTQQVGDGYNCISSGCRGKLRLEFDGSKLYNQLMYYERLFDTKMAIGKLTEEKKGTAIEIASRYQTEYATLYRAMCAKVAESAYKTVSLKSLFAWAL